MPTSIGDPGAARPTRYLSLSVSVLPTSSRRTSAPRGCGRRGTIHERAHVLHRVLGEPPRARYEVTAILVRQMLPRRLFPALSSRPASRLGRHRARRQGRRVARLACLPGHRASSSRSCARGRRRSSFSGGPVRSSISIWCLPLSRASVGPRSSSSSTRPLTRGGGDAARGGYVRLVAPLFVTSPTGILRTRWSIGPSCDAAIACAGLSQSCRSAHRTSVPSADCHRFALPRRGPSISSSSAWCGRTRVSTCSSEAFERLADADDQLWLTIVGETWESWTAPIAAARTSRTVAGSTS